MKSNSTKPKSIFGAFAALCLGAILWLAGVPEGRDIVRSAIDSLGEPTRVERRAETPAPSQQPTRQKTGTKSAATSIFDYRDGAFVTGRGRVIRILPDDLDPPRHQRFILADDAGRTLLVAHNIDLSSRLAGLAKGDVVSFRGEYRSNDAGGVIHLTHPDPNGRKTAGWVKLEK